MNLSFKYRESIPKDFMDITGGVGKENGNSGKQANVFTEQSLKNNNNTIP